MDWFWFGSLVGMGAFGIYLGWNLREVYAIRRLRKYEAWQELADAEAERRGKMVYSDPEVQAAFLHLNDLILSEHKRLFGETPLV